MKKNLIIFFIIILFSQGLLDAIGIPQVFSDATLILLPVLVLLVNKQKLRIAPGWRLVLLYVLWSVFAGIYHGETITRPLLFSRYLVIGYLILLAVYNTYFSEKQIRQINRTVFIMFFVQIAAALIELFFIGRTEAMVGTMMSGGGGPATTFPMFAFALFFSFFLFTQKVKHLLAGLAFIIVGYASGKLGIYFLIPLIAIIALFLHSKQYSGVPFFNKRVIKPVLGIMGLLLLAAILLPTADDRTERLDLSKLSYKDRIESFFNYAYEGRKSNIGAEYTGTRIGTSIRVIDETFSRSPVVFAFGQGYKAYDDLGHSYGEGTYEEYGIVYGITGWTHDALIYGWPLMILHVGFFLLIYRKLKKSRKHFKYKHPWDIYLFATILMFFVFIINYFLYNTNYTIGGWMICIHMYFAGILLAPQYKIKLTADKLESESINNK